MYRPTSEYQILKHALRRHCALYVHGIHALWRILCFKSYCIAFLQFFKSDANQRFAVEEQILLQAFSGDKTETPVGKFFDYTSLSCYIVHTFDMLIIKLQMIIMFE